MQNVVNVYGIVYTGAIIANIDTNTDFLFVKAAYAFLMQERAIISFTGVK